MAGHTKVRFKHTIPVILHADLMEDFKKAIDGTDVGVFFREIQEDVVEKYRKEKKELPPTKGAIINYINNWNKKVDEKKQQTTLDVFAKITDINKFIDESMDVRQLREMRQKAHVIETVAKTKLVKISRGLIKLE